MKVARALLLALTLAGCSSSQLTRERADNGLPPASGTRLWAVEQICNRDHSLDNAECNQARAKVGLGPEQHYARSRYSRVDAAIARRRAEANASRSAAEYRYFRGRVLRALDD